TYFAARRNEVGRHVLLELGCQNTTRRFWWDFTTGKVTEDGRAAVVRAVEREVVAAAASGLASNGLHRVAVSTLELPRELRGDNGSVTETRAAGPVASITGPTGSSGGSAPVHGPAGTNGSDHTASGQLSAYGAITTSGADSAPAPVP